MAVLECSDDGDNYLPREFVQLFLGMSGPWRLQRLQLINTGVHQD